ncbi:hypothetical protein [Haloechinothrix sp. LS1_15]|uniref:hypothetical protein n=1 Tax=Haloechinothrix sp. LS1_15 TaxID=2652248 RepID=UPI0029489087|nr:hypothetical protein [Haloechinothrix sp. LS1_15]MDV6011241.1 hypothetical protein [Haloechinothrix sp. LS1_15]
MAMPLNLTVNGSSGTCREAADWLAELAGQAEATGGWYYRATGVAESGWEGPAHDAFSDSLRGVGREIDNLDYTARQYENALRDFADALDKVIDRMQEARQIATDGGLRVEGPYIHPPEGPGEPPERGDPQFADKAAAYNEVVRAVNREVDVFNECQEIVRDARRKEDGAHDELRSVLAAPDDFDIDGWQLGLTTAATVLNSIASVENERHAALTKLENLRSNANVYQKFAAGTMTSMTEGDRGLMNRSASKAGPGEAALRQRVQEFGRLTEKLPEGAVKSIAHYPGKSQHPPGSGRAASVLKGLPYAASLSVMGNEAIGAAKGEQTWTQAGARSGGILASSWAVGKEGAKLGWRFGWKGALVGLVGGGIAGGIGADRVLDSFIPSAADEYFEPMEHYDEASRYPRDFGKSL